MSAAETLPDTLPCVLKGRSGTSGQGQFLTRLLSQYPAILDIATSLSLNKLLGGCAQRDECGSNIIEHMDETKFIPNPEVEPTGGTVTDLRVTIALSMGEVQRGDYASLVAVSGDSQEARSFTWAVLGIRARRG